MEALKTATAVHHTATDTGAWDGPANEKRLPQAAGPLRASHAWVDPEGDPAVKSTYRFIHHLVAADGSVGAASTGAASMGIGVLNGGRTGTTIPQADHAGVYAHLAAHLRDAGMEPPALKSVLEVPVGRAVKFVGPDTIEGLAIPFGGTFAGKDLAGEAFDADTDLCIDWFGRSGRPVLYDHGMDTAHKARVIGRQADYDERAEGVWAQSQLDANARYRKAIDRLIEEGALGYSSGAMPHLATKNAWTGIITRWPWVELSLTPMPAEPSTLGVHYMKSAGAAIALLESVDVAIPDPVKAALTALDEWSDTRDDDSPPDGLKFADLLDRLSVEGPAWAKARRDWSGKSGRVLSAATRERLSAHPAALRQLADDLDELLATADAPTGKSVDLIALALDYERTLARLSGVTT